MIKLVFFFAFVAAAFGDVSHLFNKPQQYYRPTQPIQRPVQPIPQSSYKSGGPQIAILRLENEVYPDGSYHYAYDTENGISAQEAGQLKGSGDAAGISAQGSFQYTSPEGVPVQIQYVADENGFQPVGNVLPTPPPIPEAILKSIQFNAHEQPQQQTYQQQPYKRY